MVMHSPASLIELVKEHPPPLIILAGDSTWEKERLLARLGEALGPSIDTVRFQPARGEPSSEEVLSLCRDLTSAPLFAERRLVVAREGDALWKAAGKRLVTLLTKQPVANVCLLWCSKAPDPQELRKLGERVVVVTCRTPTATPRSGDVPLPRWLGEQARERGLELSREAAQLLHELAGDDQHLLDEELAKIELYLGGSGRVSVELVRELVADTAGRSLDRLLEAIFAGEVARALDVYEHMRQDGFRHFSGRRITGEAMTGALLVGLQDRFRKILGVIEARELQSDEIRERLRIHSDYYWNRLEGEGRRIGRRRAEQAIRHLFAAEEAMRLEGRSAAEVLTELIVRLASTDGAKRRGR
ncbi:MAG: DNA polymerase III subunit delta [Planctomycetota bacterium]